MTTTGSFNSGNGDRILVVKIEGIRHSGVTSTSQYTLKVPYRSFARTMQFIRSKGGRVLEVTEPFAATGAIAEPVIPPVQEALSQPAPLPEVTLQPEPSPTPELSPSLEVKLPAEPAPPIAKPAAAAPAEPIAEPAIAAQTEPIAEPAIAAPASVQSVAEAPKAEALAPLPPEPEIIAPTVQNWLKFIAALIRRLKSRPDLS